ncbi:hypothetical protein IIB97_01770, partial [Patescibacteria group bacterium]|nr:hypothetical protein [Patescibacteria group bacterium]
KNQGSASKQVLNSIKNQGSASKQVLNSIKNQGSASKQVLILMTQREFVRQYWI